MTAPCIICVAITGSVPRKADNPADNSSNDDQAEKHHETGEKYRHGVAPGRFPACLERVKHTLFAADEIPIGRRPAHRKDDTRHDQQNEADDEGDA